MILVRASQRNMPFNSTHWNFFFHLCPITSILHTFNYSNSNPRFDTVPSKCPFVRSGHLTRSVPWAILSSGIIDNDTCRPSLSVPTLACIPPKTKPLGLLFSHFAKTWARQLVQFCTLTVASSPIPFHHEEWYFISLYYFNFPFMLKMNFLGAENSIYA